VLFSEFFVCLCISEVLHPSIIPDVLSYKLCMQFFPLCLVGNHLIHIFSKRSIPSVTCLLPIKVRTWQIYGLLDGRKEGSDYRYWCPLVRLQNMYMFFFWFHQNRELHFYSSWDSKCISPQQVIGHGLVSGNQAKENCLTFSFS
jgi:hypothetical protein